MTLEEKKQLKALYIATALYYGFNIPDNALPMYVEDLEDLPFDLIAQAMQNFRRNPENKKYPLPAQLRHQIKPTPTDEQNALDAVSRIVEAVSKFGPYRHDEAKTFVGELGWLVVTRDGGWLNVCENLTDENLGTFRAQWREMAKAMTARSKAGVLNTPPELPQPPKEKGLVKLGDFLGRSLGYKPESSV